MKSGKVKWFNNAKGYGFIRPDEGGEDLFVHYSYIDMDGYKSLKAGQPVGYEVTQAAKGLHATNICELAEDGSVVQRAPEAGSDGSGSHGANDANGNTGSPESFETG